MAVTSLCAKLKSGLDISCNPPVKKYYQQVVLINFDDIDPEEVVAPWTEGYPDDEAVCNYFCQFVLKNGKTGFMFKFPENGSAAFGSTDVSRSDFGYSNFLHHLNLISTSVSEVDKCKFDALAKGSFVGAAQYKDGTVEIYGLRYGISLDDTTIDPANNGGVTAVVLSSRDGAEESHLPLVYKPQDGGDANADFDSAFANTGS